MSGASLNIAIFSDSFYPSTDGVVTQISNMARQFSAMGNRVLVVAPSHTARFERKELFGAQVILLPSVALPTYKDYRITMPHSSKALRTLKEFGPDIIHIQTPFSIGWLGLRYGKALKVPIIGTYHTLLPEFLMYLPIPLIKKMGFAKALTWKYTALFYNKCNIVTTPTAAMKSELEKNGTHNVSVLSNAIDFEMFNSARAKRKNSKSLKLIYFGRVSYEKNIEGLLFGIKHMIEKKRNVSLTITGDGPAIHYLKKMAHKEGVVKNVEFTGKVTGEKLAKIVAAHDALVTASTIETQGLTIIEAMAAGLPCGGPDFLATPDTVKNGKNGFLFRAFDAQDFAAKVEKLASSAALRKKLSENAVKTAKSFAAGKIAKETILLYNKATK